MHPSRLPTAAARLSLSLLFPLLYLQEGVYQDIEQMTEAEAAKHMARLHELHENILVNIHHVQDQTAHILQEQEKDLLRAFRARLHDLQVELETERSKVTTGSSVWVERLQSLQKELEWVKDIAERLDRVNKALVKENATLKTQFRTQEDDRTYLVKQLVTAKKEAARLRSECARVHNDCVALQSEIERIRSGGGSGQEGGSKGAGSDGAAGPEGGEGDAASAAAAPAPAPLPSDLEVDTAVAYALAPVPSVSPFTGLAGAPSSPPSSGFDEARYKDLIATLKRVLDFERRSSRHLRAQLNAELAARTDAEIFLRAAIEEARTELDKKRQALLAVAEGSAGVRGARATPAAAAAAAYAFDPVTLRADDREAILASLLAQDHVLTALQRMAFPGASGASGAAASSGVNGNGKASPTASRSLSPAAAPRPTLASGASALRSASPTLATGGVSSAGPAVTTGFPLSVLLGASPLPPASPSASASGGAPFTPSGSGVLGPSASLGGGGGSRVVTASGSVTGGASRGFKASFLGPAAAAAPPAALAIRAAPSPGRASATSGTKAEGGAATPGASSRR